MGCEDSVKNAVLGLKELRGQYSVCRSPITDPVLAVIMTEMFAILAVSEMLQFHPYIIDRPIRARPVNQTSR